VWLLCFIDDVYFKLLIFRLNITISCVKIIFDMVRVFFSKPERKKPPTFCSPEDGAVQCGLKNLYENSHLIIIAFMSWEPGIRGAFQQCLLLFSSCLI